jgi:OmpA-OmpF porin, OOP family
VQLVRAGHEYHTLGWRHATGYFAIAEDLAAQAGREAAACAPPPVPVSAAPVPTPAPAPLPPPPAPPAPVPKPVRATLTLGADVLFKFDRAAAGELQGEGLRQLDEAARRLKQVDLTSVLVIGHTDPQGATAYNQRLSLRRAETVKALLVQRGVPAEKVSVEGRGEAEPVAPCDRRRLKGAALNQCDQPNRRVVIDFEYLPRP